MTSLTVKRVPEASLASFLPQLLEEDMQTADVKIILQDKSILPAHKCFLSASPVLKSTLTCLESRIDKIPHISIAEFDKETVICLLNFLYKGFVVLKKKSSTEKQFYSLCQALRIDPPVDSNTSLSGKPSSPSMVDVDLTGDVVEVIDEEESEESLSKSYLEKEINQNLDSEYDGNCNHVNTQDGSNLEVDMEILLDVPCRKVNSLSSDSATSVLKNKHKEGNTLVSGKLEEASLKEPLNPRQESTDMKPFSKEAASQEQETLKGKEPLGQEPSENETIVNYLKVNQPEIAVIETIKDPLNCNLSANNDRAGKELVSQKNNKYVIIEKDSNISISQEHVSKELDTQENAFKKQISKEEVGKKEANKEPNGKEKMTKIPYNHDNIQDGSDNLETNCNETISNLKSSENPVNSSDKPTQNENFNTLQTNHESEVKASNDKVIPESVGQKDGSKESSNCEEVTTHFESHQDSRNKMEDKNIRKPVNLGKTSPELINHDQDRILQANNENIIKSDKHEEASTKQVTKTNVPNESNNKDDNIHEESSHEPDIKKQEMCKSPELDSREPIIQGLPKFKSGNQEVTSNEETEALIFQNNEIDGVDLSSLQEPSFNNPESVSLETLVKGELSNASELSLPYVPEHPPCDNLNSIDQMNPYLAMHYDEVSDEETPEHISDYLNLLNSRANLEASSSVQEEIEVDSFKMPESFDIPHDYIKEIIPYSHSATIDLTKSSLRTSDDELDVREPSPVEQDNEVLYVDSSSDTEDAGLTDKLDIKDEKEQPNSNIPSNALVKDVLANLSEQIQQITYKKQENSIRYRDTLNKERKSIHAIKDRRKMNSSLFGSDSEEDTSQSSNSKKKYKKSKSKRSGTSSSEEGRTPTPTTSLMNDLEEKKERMKKKLKSSIFSSEDNVHINKKKKRHRSLESTRSTGPSNPAKKPHICNSSCTCVKKLRNNLDDEFIVSDNHPTSSSDSECEVKKKLPKRAGELSKKLKSKKIVVESLDNSSANEETDDETLEERRKRLDERKAKKGGDILAWMSKRGSTNVSVQLTPREVILDKALYKLHLLSLEESPESSQETEEVVDRLQSDTDSDDSIPRGKRFTLKSSSDEKPKEVKREVKKPKKRLKKKKKKEKKRYDTSPPRSPAEEVLEVWTPSMYSKWDQGRKKGKGPKDSDSDQRGKVKRQLNRSLSSEPKTGDSISGSKSSIVNQGKVQRSYSTLGSSLVGVGHSFGSSSMASLPKIPKLKKPE